jgi:hypothetical protein
MENSAPFDADAHADIENGPSTPANVAKVANSNETLAGLAELAEAPRPLRRPLPPSAPFPIDGPESNAEHPVEHTRISSSEVFKHSVIERTARNFSQKRGILREAIRTEKSGLKRGQTSLKTHF